MLSGTCVCRQSFTFSSAVRSMYSTVMQLGFILLPSLETTVVQFDLTSIDTTSQTLNKQKRRLSILASAFPGRNPAAFVLFIFALCCLLLLRCFSRRRLEECSGFASCRGCPLAGLSYAGSDFGPDGGSCCFDLEPLSKLRQTAELS